jgi:dipicolinate synthase subunit A
MWQRRSDYMDPFLFATAGRSGALDCCVNLLMEKGCTFTSNLTDPVTHLILPVPSVDEDGHIKGDGPLQEVLAKLSPTATVIGGNLPQQLLGEHPVIDLLQDEDYVCQNAYITAHCAMALAAEQLDTTFRDCRCLIIGWGRIGKCLAEVMTHLEAEVTVAVRNPRDQAMLEALGYKCIAITKIDPTIYDLIFNTAPYLLLPDCKGKALKIDLASKPGIDAEGVIWARGLPGIHRPESSGKLIAQTFLRLISREGSP